MAPFTGVAFYLSAHQDDWQLFRGEVGYNDVALSGAKIVFVFATAGDAGEAGDADSGWWEAREAGAITTVRAAIGHPCPVVWSVATTAAPFAHPIQRYTCANAVLWFLRLPDGSPEGTGYPATGSQSLAHLQATDQPITAVDGSTTYASWADFCGTLQAIISAEEQGFPGPNWINCADYALTVNQGDHADHHAVANAVRALVAAGQHAYHRAWYSTYRIADLPPNLDGTDLDRKQATFDAYSAEVLRMTSLDGQPVPGATGEWAAWGPRSYAREVLSPDPDPDEPPRPPWLVPSRRRRTMVQFDPAVHGTRVRP